MKQVELSTTDKLTGIENQLFLLRGKLANLSLNDIRGRIEDIEESLGDIIYGMRQEEKKRQSTIT